MDSDPEKAFALRDQFFGIANSLKAYEGHLTGLQDAAMMAKMKARDEALVEKSGKPEVKAAFEAIANGYAEFKALIEDKSSKQSARTNMQRTLAQEIVPPNKAILNKARFDAYGKDLYPDATFTLRLAFGTVTGYEAGTTKVPPRTTFNGLYERNSSFDNEAPYDLPKRWQDAKAKLNLETSYNFVCTADIIGGNSGSPILDRNANVVGLVFDGNIESLPGNYWFDERVNRCVGVHAAGMIEALDKVYGEAELVKELRGK